MLIEVIVAGSESRAGAQMQFFKADMSGTDFRTSRGVPGFMTRGALADLTGLLPYGHRWHHQDAAFATRVAEIEAFADGMADLGMLEDGVAVITPRHVCYS